MINRIVKLTFKEEHLGEFPKMFEDIRNIIAGSEGCYGVQLLHDINDPRVYFTYSQWDNEDYLNKYKDTEFFGKTWKKLKSMFDDKPQAWSTEIINQSDKQWS